MDHIYWSTLPKEKLCKEDFTPIVYDCQRKCSAQKKETGPVSPGLPPGILTPPPSLDQDKSLGKEVPANLPKMFIDLLEPVQGLRLRKLDHECPVCLERFATKSSLDTHNKSHPRPACLKCYRRFPSVSAMFKHRQSCCNSSQHVSIGGRVCKDEDTAASEPNTVFVTSKYGRARNVKSYVGFS